MSDLPHGGRKPLRTEALLFVGAAVFFAVIAGIYGLLTTWEPVGATALFLLAGLGGLTGIYLLVLGNRIDPRPEDDPFADIEDGAGEVGVFSPWSWWPLVLALSLSLVVLGLCIGFNFWLTFLSAPLVLIGVIGWVFEYYRGHFAR